MADDATEPLALAHLIPSTNRSRWTALSDQLATELAPQRVAPAKRGWRRWLHAGTLGLVNLGPSAEDQRRRALDAAIGTRLGGHYKIGTVGKGGVGKTSVAVCVGSVLAEWRRGDRVVAVDADTAFGKLGSRIDQAAGGGYWSLAGSTGDTFAELLAHLGSNAAGLFVLAGEGPAPRRALNPGLYRKAVTRLDRHFTISIIDCGSTLDTAVTREAMRDLDALIVVASPRVDGASAAADKLQWLAGSGMEALLARTVIVLNDSDGHADKETRAMWRQELLSGGRPVFEMPFDPHLRAGGVIDITGRLASDTRQHVVEIAAAIAEHFGDVSDRR